MNPFQAVEPETLEWIRAVARLGLPPVYELTVEEARANFTVAMTAAPSTREVTTEDAVLDGVPVRIARPEGRRGGVPAAMYFHGGGWVLGNKTAHERFAKELAYQGDVAVVYVDYALSPEARFPVAVEQCYAATKYVAERGGELGIDGARIAVVGDSAGGGMAAVVAMLAKERGGPAIRQQTLICPVTDAGFDTVSYRQFARGYPLTDEAMKWFWKHYAPEEEARRSPLASPLRAETQALRGLPRALVITAELDVLRDEGEAFAHKLMDAGVRVTGTRYMGTVHNFMLPAAMAQRTVARKAMAEIGAELREALRA